MLEPSTKSSFVRRGWRLETEDDNTLIFAQFKDVGLQDPPIRGSAPLPDNPTADQLTRATALTICLAVDQWARAQEGSDE